MEGTASETNVRVQVPVEARSILEGAIWKHSPAAKGQSKCLIRHASFLDFYCGACTAKRL